MNVARIFFTICVILYLIVGITCYKYILSKRVKNVQGTGRTDSIGRFVSNSKRELSSMTVLLFWPVAFPIYWALAPAWNNRQDEVERAVSSDAAVGPDADDSTHSNPGLIEKMQISTMLFLFGVVFMLSSGFEQVTGLSLPSRNYHGLKPIASGDPLDQFIIAVCLIALGCIVKGFEPNDE